MTIDLDKYMVPPFNQEVENEDTVLRRVNKLHHVDEDGNILPEVFLLRNKLPNTNKPEAQISVIIEKISGIPALTDRKKRYAYCRLIAGNIREAKVGVWHNPTDEDFKNAHGSLCGYFDEQKATTLSSIAELI